MTEQNALQLALTERRDDLLRLVPKHIQVDHVIQQAAMAMSYNPGLKECFRTEAGKEGLLRSALKAAELGINFSGGPMAEAWLVPFKGIVQLIISYRGLAMLVMREPDVLYVDAEVVCEHDEFEMDRAGGKDPHHKIGAKARGPIVGAWAMIRYVKAPSFPRTFYMNREELEAVRLASLRPNKGPWKDFYPQMCRKTVVRRLCAMMPICRDLVKAIRLEEETYHMVDAKPLGSESLTDRLAPDRPTTEAPPQHAAPIDEDVACHDPEGEVVQGPVGLDFEAIRALPVDTEFETAGEICGVLPGPKSTQLTLRRGGDDQLFFVRGNLPPAAAEVGQFVHATGGKVQEWQGRTYFWISKIEAMNP